MQPADHRTAGVCPAPPVSTNTSLCHIWCPWLHCLPLGNFASLFVLHTFSLHWTLLFCPKTSTDQPFLTKFSPTLLQTSTITLSSPVHYLFLRMDHMHSLPSMPGLCLAAKSLKWPMLLPFSPPHSQLQPVRIFPGCLHEPQEQKQLSISISYFHTPVPLLTLFPPHGLPFPAPTTPAQVLPLFQVQSLQLEALALSSQLC